MRLWAAAGCWDPASPPPGFDVYVSKTTTVQPRQGPNLVRRLSDDAWLNQIGVTNPGIDATLRSLPKVPGDLVLSILGSTLEDWGWLALTAQDAGIKAVECNLSCPNVQTGQTEPHRVVEIVRSHFDGDVGAKLGPLASWNDALALCEAGVSYIAAVNSLPTFQGGFSGKPLRPLALATIAEIARVATVPIVGGGGLTDTADVSLYLKAGATDVFMGSALLI